MASKGLKAHKKAQKDKAIAKRIAAAAVSAGKSKKNQIKKAAMTEDKVENPKILENVQENTVKDIVETGTSITEDFSKNIVKSEDYATLSNTKAVSSLSVDVCNNMVDDNETVMTSESRKYTSTTPPTNHLTDFSAAATPLLASLFEKLDVIVGCRAKEDFLFASKETPQQFLKRVGHSRSDTTEKTPTWDGECERETFAAVRAIDDNGFECIGFRVKDTVQDTFTVKVLSVDQLYAMFKNNGVTAHAVSTAPKATETLEVIEKNRVFNPYYPLSTIAEEDSDSVSPRSGSISEPEDTSQSSLASTVEDAELFSRSVTPFSDTLEKQEPVVRLPSAVCSPSHAARLLECTKAGASLFRNSIKQDSEIPFDPATKICSIIVHHNIGEVPNPEQIKAAIVFTCPDETLETSALETALPVVNPAIVSFKEKKPDIQFTTQIAVETIDPAILSASVKYQEVIDPALLTSKVKDLSPTAAVFTPGGAHSPPSPISLQEGSDILKAVLGIATPQDSASRRTSYSLPTPKDARGPHTPDTPTFKASLKSAILPEHCEKVFVPVSFKEQRPILPSLNIVSGPHSPINAILPEHCENEFVPAKQQDFGANGGYDYRDAAPGQYWPEQVYAQYQQPHMYPGAGGYGYSPYDGVPEYYQMAWDAV